jgi:nucleotide-binding universal stress UspA family protein
MSALVQRILVATDFSEDADRALAMAIALGQALAATVDLVHVYRLPMPDPLSVAGALTPALPAPDDVVNAHRQLGERADRVREAGVECVATAVGGDAAAEIVSHARKACAELVVMGRRGVSGLRRMFLGSVTERVLRTSESPVLVIPRAAGSVGDPA